MNMKKIIIFILILIIALGSVSCRADYSPAVITPAPTPEPTPEPFNPQNFSIGVYCDNELILKGINDKCSELGYTPEIISGELTDALDWAKNGGSGLIICGAGEYDRAAINETAAYGCGIITIMFDGLSSPKGVKCNLTYSAESIGEQCAGILFEKVKDINGNVAVCLSDSCESISVKSFAEEFDKLCASDENTNIKILNTEYCNNPTDVNNLLSRGGYISAVFSGSAEVAAVFADSVAGSEKKPIIVSAEASADTIKKVKNGQIYACALAPHYDMGCEAVKKLDAVFKGEDYTPGEFKSTIITADNVDEYAALLNR